MDMGKEETQQVSQSSTWEAEGVRGGWKNEEQFIRVTWRYVYAFKKAYYFCLRIVINLCGIYLKCSFESYES